MNIISFSLIIRLGLVPVTCWANSWNNPTRSGSIVGILNTDGPSEGSIGTVVFGNVIDNKGKNEEEISGDFLAHTLIGSNPTGMPVDCLDCTFIITDAVECSPDAFANASQFPRTNSNFYAIENRDSSIRDGWRNWETLSFDSLEEATNTPQSVFYSNANEEMIACALLQPTSNEMADELSKVLNGAVYEAPISTPSESGSAVVSSFVVGGLSMAAVTVLLFV